MSKKNLRGSASSPPMILEFPFPLLMAGKKILPKGTLGSNLPEKEKNKSSSLLKTFPSMSNFFLLSS
jgi:hypothetical protein